MRVNVGKPAAECEAFSRTAGFPVFTPELRSGNAVRPAGAHRLLGGGGLSCGQQPPSHLRQNSIKEPYAACKCGVRFFLCALRSGLKLAEVVVNFYRACAFILGENDSQVLLTLVIDSYGMS